MRHFPLATARLRLVPLTPADTDALAALLAEPGARRFLCDDEILPREAVAAMIGDSVDLAPEGLGLWRIAAEGDEWVGCVGLLPVSGAALAARPDFAGGVEPIIALAGHAWGRGYAAEALRAAVAHGMDGLALPRLVALVDEPNARSHALMRRVGFRQVGTGPGPRHPLSAYELTRDERP
ncbi:MAG TPA: GNAT family N-acetyltransferase [Azospirillaceae bacterium]|nr:GNAT family N-acetyltransferase [Azospirillaceae bacterium]